MKKISTVLLTLSLLILALSCGKTTADSEFKEFQMQCQDGMTRSAGLYIPKGISKDKTYPVIYMADGLVFKECGFKKLIDSLVDSRIISPVIVACSYENKKTVPGYNLA